MSIIPFITKQCSIFVFFLTFEKDRVAHIKVFYFSESLPTNGGLNKFRTFYKGLVAFFINISGLLNNILADFRVFLKVY